MGAAPDEIDAVGVAGEPGPVSPQTGSPAGSPPPGSAPPGKEPPRGDRNANPDGMRFWALVREDLRVHDSSLAEPGWWALMVHRFGNARMGVRFRPWRAVLTLVHNAMYLVVRWFFGIELSYVVPVGRRVRLYHHGAMILNARSIGDDVHIRHCTTIGVASRAEPWARPVIGSGVDIGVGAVIVGDIVVGDGAVIGANAAVVRDVEPRTVVGGVPAKLIRRLDDSAGGVGASS